MNAARFPERTHHYQNALFNGSRWDRFVSRTDDIIIATSYKAGTTWMQGICAALVFQQPRPPLPQDALTPWLDANFAPLDRVLDLLEGLQHRRYIKTHLPLDGLRFLPEARYIYVGRDGLDVFMSMWNHWHNMLPERIEGLNNAPDRRGPILPQAPDDILSAFDDWLSRGSFPWESNGYPFWSHLHHARSWLEFRHLPNIHVVHFQNLLDDLGGEMRRIAAFLDIPVDESIWDSLVAGVTFDAMKANAAMMAPGGSKNNWKDTGNFFHRGTSRRWEGVLGEAQVRSYRELSERELGVDLAQWLAHGGQLN
ncbi:MAG: sulfotransferase domain-containing protein [Gammaproteobacteria bacterium]|nr:sulfotransferase domain-containing protein [Pseudomonadales bacterium]MCP5345441.1 sulfotransferase domain-containing protein [Pseudomonadales bacterium]